MAPPFVFFDQQGEQLCQFTFFCRRLCPFVQLEQ
jgi:hypothetical protein